MKNTKAFVPAAIITLIVTTIISIYLAQAQKLSLIAFTGNTIKNLYIYTHENIFIIRRLNNINANIYFYIIIAFSAAATFLYKKITNLKSTEGLNSIITVSIIAFILFAALQTANHINRFSAERKTFSGKSTHEKKSIIFGLPYHFADFCRKQLSGKHRAKLITDLDLGKDPGMTLHRRLSYHSYPINIRLSTGKPQDCYIAFQKKDISSAIPKGYTKIYNFNEYNAIAIKKETQE